MRAIAAAPGKVIFTGEHFVVHGALALAASIDRRVTVKAERFDGLEIRSEQFPGGATDQGPLAPLVEAVRGMYQLRGMHPSVRLHISSEIPPGSGLGSSAACAVAAVWAVDELEGWHLSRDDLVERAMVAERAVHGRPSGIDVAASAIGGVFLFRMGEAPQAGGGQEAAQADSRSFGHGEEHQGADRQGLQHEGRLRQPLPEALRGGLAHILRRPGRPLQPETSKSSESSSH